MVLILENPVKLSQVKVKYWFSISALKLRGKRKGRRGQTTLATLFQSKTKKKLIIYAVLVAQPVGGAPICGGGVGGGVGGAEKATTKWQDKISSNFDRLVAFAATEMDKVSCAKSF